MRSAPHRLFDLRLPPGKARDDTTAEEGANVRPELRQALADELIARGYSVDGLAPHGTMNLGPAYLESVTMCDLLDQLISRREKIARSVPVVGQDVAEAGYADVVNAICIHQGCAGGGLGRARGAMNGRRIVMENHHDVMLFLNLAAAAAP